MAAVVIALIALIVGACSIVITKNVNNPIEKEAVEIAEEELDIPGE